MYTSQLDTIYDALESLIRDPSGCFEQTSSTTYPLVMALQVMQNLPERSEKIESMESEGLKKLKDGYEHLLTFESKSGGYEWFGDDPGHEALSAYGLLQFREMEEVLPEVDSSMVSRVETWLLDKRDGKGGFNMNSHGLDSFGSPPEDIADAYILWVLTTTMSDAAGLDKEIEKQVNKVKSSEDSYLIALVAMVLQNADRHVEAKTLLDILSSKQNEEGMVEGADSSITRSSGKSLDVETTALSTLAFMRQSGGAYSAQAEKGVQFIVSSVEDGSYGSTQATILSLKVLVEFLKNVKLDGSGTFELLIDDQVVKSYKFDDTTKTDSLDFDEEVEKYLSSRQESYQPGTPHTFKLNLNNF